MVTTRAASVLSLNSPERNTTICNQNDNDEELHIPYKLDLGFLGYMLLPAGFIALLLLGVAC